MPIVIIQIRPSEVNRKKILINGITEVFAKAGYNKDRVKIVINEVPGENIGIGGITLTEFLKQKGEK